MNKSLMLFQKNRKLPSYLNNFNCLKNTSSIPLSNRYCLKIFHLFLLKSFEKIKFYSLFTNYLKKLSPIRILNYHMQ